MGLLSTLEDNLPPEDFEKIKDKIPAEIIEHTQEDYEYARDGLKRLIERSEQTIEVLYNLMEESEHPRVGEVLSNTIKTTSEMMERLLDLQEKRKKLNNDNLESKKSSGDTNIQNNIVFSGDTASMQRMIADAMGK